MILQKIGFDMKFLSVFITFIVLSSSVYSDEDFDTFIEIAHNNDGLCNSEINRYRIKSIIDLIENVNKITYDFLYEEGYNGPRYEIQKKSIAASLSCQLAVELNTLKKNREQQH